MTPAVEARALRFRYAARRAAGVRALDDLSIRIEPQRHVALLGPNGSGKSTLFGLLTAMLAVQEGSIELFGGPPASNRHRIGMVFQQPALDPHLTADENLRLQAGLFGWTGVQGRERMAQRTELLGITALRSRRVGTLSGGERRRVDLARALLHDPDLLLLDEATVGLDPAARGAFLDAIEQERMRRPLTILTATHLVDEADRADEVILMHRGRVIAEDAPSALRAALGARRLQVHDPDFHPPEEERDQWTTLPGAGWVRALPDQGLPELAYRLASEGRSFTIAPPTLADVFLVHTGTMLAHEEVA